MAGTRLQASSDRYGVAAQFFHWLIVLLILVQFTLGRVAENLPAGFEKFVLMSRHKSLGITILALAMLRLAWRFLSRPPPPPQGLNPFLRWSGRVTHFMLYLLLFALPISGWLASSAANSPVSWWGWLTLPDLIGAGDSSFERLSGWHALMTRLLLVFAGLHVAAALLHHFYFKDNVLRRMLPGWPGMDK